MLEERRAKEKAMFEYREAYINSLEWSAPTQEGQTDPTAIAQAWNMVSSELAQSNQIPSTADII